MKRNRINKSPSSAWFSVCLPPNVSVTCTFLPTKPPIMSRLHGRLTFGIVWTWHKLEKNFHRNLSVTPAKTETLYFTVLILFKQVVADSKAEGRFWGWLCWGKSWLMLLSYLQNKTSENVLYQVYLAEGEAGSLDTSWRSYPLTFTGRKLLDRGNFTWIFQLFYFQIKHQGKMQRGNSRRTCWGSEDLEKLILTDAMKHKPFPTWEITALKRATNDQKMHFESQTQSYDEWANMFPSLNSCSWHYSQKKGLFSINTIRLIISSSAPPEASASSLPPAGGAAVKHDAFILSSSWQIGTGQILYLVSSSVVFINEKIQKEVVWLLVRTGLLQILSLMLSLRNTMLSAMMVVAWRRTWFLSTYSP